VQGKGLQTWAVVCALVECYVQRRAGSMVRKFRLSSAGVPAGILRPQMQATGEDRVRRSQVRRWLSPVVRSRSQDAGGDAGATERPV